MSLLFISVNVCVGDLQSGVNASKVKESCFKKIFLV
jgi:hypothetical protein